jgi:hypothetical protein
VLHHRFRRISTGNGQVVREADGAHRPTCPDENPAIVLAATPGRTTPTIVHRYRCRATVVQRRRPGAGRAVSASSQERAIMGLA